VAVRPLYGAGRSGPIDLRVPKLLQRAVGMQMMPLTVAQSRQFNPAVNWGRTTSQSPKASRNTAKIVFRNIVIGVR